MEFEGDADLVVGTTASQMECGTDFSSSGFCSVGSFRVVVVQDVDNGGHIGVQGRCVVRHEALVGTQHDDAGIPRDPRDVDARQERSEDRAGLHLVEAGRDPLVVVAFRFVQIQHTDNVSAPYDTKLVPTAGDHKESEKFQKPTPNNGRGPG